MWFALAVADHPHHPAARTWCHEEAALAGFCRLPQLGLRLLTTASAMGLPLTNEEAWGVYDASWPTPACALPRIACLRRALPFMLSVRQPSPKVLVDAYLAAHAAANEAELITFNQALTAYGFDCR